MSTVNSKFYYWNTGTSAWVEATAIMACELTARLNAPSVLSVTLSNVNQLDSTFNSFKKVKLTERQTTQDIFVGRVESSNPAYDDKYGPVLKLTCYDYMQSLKNRFMNGTYSGYTRRSDIVNDMVTGAIYSGDLNVSAISASESTGTISYLYTSSEVLPFTAVSDIAKEDPWATGTGVGYDFRVDLGTQLFRYFKRGSLPTGGTSASGLTLTFQEATSTRSKNYMQDYSFTDSPKETITRVTVRGTTSAGASISATAVNTTAEAALGLYKEKIVTVYGSASTTAILQNRADATLHQTLGPSIARGKVNIFGFPYYTLGASSIILMPGDLVHVHNSRYSPAINDDYLVSSVIYREPQTVSEINLVKGIVGWGVPPEDFSGFVEQTQTQTVNMAKMGDLLIDDAKITSCSIGKLTAGSISVTGTLAVGGMFIAGPATGAHIIIDATGVYGYSNATAVQFYLQTSDGKAYCGGGRVILSSTGIDFWNTSASTTTCTFYDKDGVKSGELYAKSPATGIYMYSYGSLDIEAAGGELDLTGEGIQLWSSTGIGLDTKNCYFIDLPQKSAAPSGVFGRMYYNTGDKIVYIFDARDASGGTWHST